MVHALITEYKYKYMYEYEHFIGLESRLHFLLHFLLLHLSESTSFVLCVHKHNQGITLDVHIHRLPQTLLGIILRYELAFWARHAPLDVLVVVGSVNIP